MTGWRALESGDERDLGRLVSSRKRGLVPLGCVEPASGNSRRDVLHPLERRGELLELGVSGELRQHLQHAPRFERADRGQRPARQHGAHVAHVVAALLQHVASGARRETPSAPRSPSSSGDALESGGGRIERADRRPHPSPVSSGRSTSIRNRPCACRRRPNGSREPVGARPPTNRPTSVSSLSAIDTAAHVTAPAPSCARLGGASARPPRQVVVVDGLPHRLGLALLARVDAAHRALQLGELAHHVRARDRPWPAALPSRPAAASAGCPAPRARSTRASASIRSAFAGSCRASCGTGSCRAARAASSGTCRSASQKNCASRSRAVSTRSALRLIARPLDLRCW